MITLAKIRLCILVIASAACLGFSGSANGMQKARKPFGDPNEYHLLCNGDSHCVELYYFGSGPVSSDEMLESAKGKHIWDIAPITQLHWTEKRKLKESIVKARRDTAKIGCQLIVSKEFSSFTIDATVMPVRRPNSSIAFLIQYSKIFSNRPLKIPGRTVESEESSEEGREIGRRLRDLPGSRGQSSDDENLDAELAENLLPFGLYDESFGNEQQSI